MEFLAVLNDFYHQKLQDNPMETLQKYILPLEFLHEANNYYLRLWQEIAKNYHNARLPKIRREVLEKNLKNLGDVLDFRKTSSIPYDFSVIYDCQSRARGF